MKINDSPLLNSGNIQSVNSMVNFEKFKKLNGVLMHGLGSVDPGMDIDWGKTSLDYARYRPGPPSSFYAKLLTLGIGKKNQKILDLLKKKRG